MSLCGSEVEGDNAEGFALPLSQKRKKKQTKNQENPEKHNNVGNRTFFLERV